MFTVTEATLLADPAPAMLMVEVTPAGLLSGIATAVVFVPETGGGVDPGVAVSVVELPAQITTSEDAVTEGGEVLIRLAVNVLFVASPSTPIESEPLNT